MDILLNNTHSVSAQNEPQISYTLYDERMLVSSLFEVYIRLLQKGFAAKKQDAAFFGSYKGSLLFFTNSHLTSHKIPSIFRFVG